MLFGKTKQLDINITEFDAFAAAQKMEKVFQETTFDDFQIVAPLSGISAQEILETSIKDFEIYKSRLGEITKEIIRLTTAGDETSAVIDALNAQINTLKKFMTSANRPAEDTKPKIPPMKHTGIKTEIE